MLRTDEIQTHACLVGLKLLGEETSINLFITFPISSYFSGGRGEGEEGEEDYGRVTAKRSENITGKVEPFTDFKKVC